MASPGALEAGAPPTLSDFETTVWPRPQAMSSPEALMESSARRPSRRIVVIGVVLTAGLAALLVGGFLLAQSVAGDKQRDSAATVERPGEVDVAGDGDGEAEAVHRGSVHPDILASHAPTTSKQGGSHCGYAGCATGSRRTKTTTSTPRRGTGITSTTTPGTTTTVENKCYSFIANLNINPLQV